MEARGGSSSTRLCSPSSPGPEVDTVLVHEWLTNLAGSEKVVAALRRSFPGSPVVTTMCWREAFPDWSEIITSPLQAAARGPQSHLRVLPLMPAAFRAVRLPASELVVTSFHTFALWAPVHRDTPHLVYCHTPPRFIWGPGQFDERSRLSRRLAAAAGVALRTADRARPAVRRGSLRTPGPSPPGSDGCTAGRQPSCTRLSRWSASRPGPTARGRTTSWCSPAWCRPSGSIWPSPPSPS